MNKRLAEFVCLRLDHEQMQRLKKAGRLAVPTQGNQVLLDPEGNYIPGIEPRGSRYKVEKLIELLDDVLRRHPPREEHKNELRLEWFLWNPQDQGLPEIFGAAALSRLDRKPVLTLCGAPPDWLDEPDFMRRHLRGFIWTRGPRKGPPRITVQMNEPHRKELLNLPLEGTSPEEVGRRLDEAWLAYMLQRPQVARGYIDNEHGRWLRDVMERAHVEEMEVQRLLEAGQLRPPGRRE